MNYKTTDKKTGKAQWWTVIPNNQQRVFLRDMISFYGQEARIMDLEKVLKQVNEMTAMSLVAIPLSVEGEDAPTNTRLSYRGYENDKDPIVIRGKTIPEVHASLTIVDGKLCFVSKSYGVVLTEAQVSTLNERFGEEVSGILRDPAVLGRVKKQERDEILKTVKQDIGTIRRQLDQIEGFKG